jgi:hypothetical protein
MDRRRSEKGNQEKEIMMGIPYLRIQRSISGFYTLYVPGVLKCRGGMGFSIEQNLQVLSPIFLP